MAEHCYSCGAPIEWAITPKGSRMPLDLTSSRDANIIVDDDGIAYVVGKGEGTRISHFATCPNSAQHRRRDRR